MRFEMFRRRNWRGRSRWFWRLRAENGRSVAIGGEGYCNRAECIAGICLVQQTGEQTRIEDLSTRSPPSKFRIL